MFRSSLLDVWATRGPFGGLTKSLCGFGDMTPSLLTRSSVELRPRLTATATSVRADRRDSVPK